MRSANLPESKDVATGTKFPPRPTHLPWGDSTQNVRARETVEMVSGYCVASYRCEKMCIPPIVSGILWY